MSNKKKLIPTLRFPEFKEDGEWEEKKLGEVSQPILEKTKGKKYTLMSITSGVGLVTQIEKFGREIAGQSYKNYYVLRRGDFAYNKSSTKLYPEGEIAVLDNIENGAVPNSIFTCFRFQETQVLYKFAKYPFVNNLHGRWLKNYITVGARANGALQVNSKDFFSIPFPFPPLPEQQKIADCLSSLDDLLAAHNEKLELLKGHKKGLLQNLFPQEGETVPKVRFPEFEDDGEWELKPFSKFIKLYRGSSPCPIREYLTKEETGVNWIKIGDTSSITDFVIRSVSEKITPKGAEKSRRVKKGELILANSMSYGSTYLLEVEGCIYDGWFVLREYEEHFDKQFLLQLLNSEYTQGQYKRFAAGGIVQNISSEIVYSITLSKTSKEEQQKIASCLSAVDELIIAQQEKIDELQQHKKGLMQGLFPKMEN